ncbi:MAG: transketolase C-terminal domain-containing protein [Minisyncoccia bacterium]|jgi:transketolase
MLNPDAKLNPKLFDADVERKPTRDGYGDGLLAAGEDNRNVVALCADLTESTRTEAFAKKFPERFIEMGVAEQNMAAIAAGLGVSGKIPFIASFATFSPGRNWEQIRTTIAYNDANVKIAGHHAGVSTGADGATHQATEDIAMMRAMPNMKVFVPCDAVEAKKATLAAARIWGPVYLRFERERTPIVTTEETPYLPGKAEVFWESKKPQVLIVGCGGLLYNALVAARELEKEKIGTVVLDCHTIKPLDEKRIAELAKKIGAVVTVEEHQVSGGLGGAVAEALAKHAPVPMEFVGLHDVFGESGPPDALITKYGMGVKDIVSAAKKVLRRKK